MAKLPIPLIVLNSLTLLSLQNLNAQPGNDECINAISISSLFGGYCGVANLSMVIDNTGATGNPTDPPEPGGVNVCPQANDLYLFGDTSIVMETSIWFTFEVPNLNGDGSLVNYALWTSDGSLGDCGLNPDNILEERSDTQVVIYETNTCPDNTTPVCNYFAANDDLFEDPPYVSGWFDIQFTPGQKYYMLIDTWDGTEGEFCLSVTPCGSGCGDDYCASSETYCSCADCQNSCTFGDIAAYEYDEQTAQFSFSEDLSGNIFFCSDFVFGAPGVNTYLAFGSSFFVDCNGNDADISITLSNGSILGVNANNDGTFTIQAGIPRYIELLPADIAAGSITITSEVGDGLGNTCGETITINYTDYTQATDPYCGPSCTQTINFYAGWNLISLNVSPANKAIQSIFADAIATDNLEFITGFDLANDGAKTFDPGIPIPFNTLQEVADGFGYWVKMINATTVTFQGGCMAGDFRKPFDAGWNLIAYPPNAPQATSDYFADLIADGNLEFVTGFDGGTKTFDPNIPDSFNTLQQLENGFGYWVKVSNASE